jgi:hypothetical protein
VRSNAAHAGVSAAAGQDSASSWRLTFSISGGFAGFDRTLELSSAGSAKAIDRRRTRQVDRQLSRDEIQEIDRLAASVTSFEGSARTQCRDALRIRSISRRQAGASRFVSPTTILPSRRGDVDHQLDADPQSAARGTLNGRPSCSF